MSDSPRKQDASSPPTTPSEPAAPERRRRGRRLLAASAAGAALAVSGCEPFMTTNPAPCIYDSGFYDWDCDPSNGVDGEPRPDADAGTDAGTDGGTLVDP
ncbi:hypothetical protein [Corallococcus terminator]|uniref:Uncharacterized protein n=1 Tax=Corallococcus terminator TaxID=2316733 RepID=A0A3A8ISE8_9BACT|nr:hypothetical protein [Corallococcus terminator]RKG86245.1 hypothetical protein D7V88_18190 [Corallococcus terminator]